MAKKRRLYLQYLSKSADALEAGIGCYNLINNKHRNESTLILLCNAWELLAKAVLIKHKSPINGSAPDTSISAAEATHRLLSKGLIDETDNGIAQQVICLRNEASHGILPAFEVEVGQHLLFFLCKLHRKLTKAQFPAQAKALPNQQYVALGFETLTTFSDRVLKAVAKMRKKDDSKRLIWLLEKGLSFDGAKYMNQEQFEKIIRKEERPFTKLKLQKQIAKGENIRFVPIQAPRNYTADIRLRKGSGNAEGLPVWVRKENPTETYPHLTNDLAKLIGKTANWVAKTVRTIGLLGDSRYHFKISTSSKTEHHRYSVEALVRLKDLLTKNPDFNPYKSESNGDYKSTKPENGAKDQANDDNSRPKAP